MLEQDTREADSAQCVVNPRREARWQPGKPGGTETYL